VTNYKFIPYYCYIIIIFNLAIFIPSFCNYVNTYFFKTQILYILFFICIKNNIILYFLLLYFAFIFRNINIRIDIVSEVHAFLPSIASGLRQHQFCDVILTGFWCFYSIIHNNNNIIHNIAFAVHIHKLNQQYKKSIIKTIEKRQCLFFIVPVYLKIICLFIILIQVL
jgi:hypothetical protein